MFNRKRDSPAIPDPSNVVYREWFELHERVTIFEDIEHDLMRPARGHFFKAPLPSQTSLFEGG